jgi:hypothetical protein
MAINNKIAQDFKLVNDDLYYTPSGDFSIEPSDNQHVQDILQSEPGWWKEFPHVGAGVRRLLKAKINLQRIESTCKEQLEADGYQCGRPKFSVSSNGLAIINPNAKRVRF